MLTGDPMDDTLPIRYFSSEQADDNLPELEVLVANSWGKPMGINGERVGFLSGITSNSSLVDYIESELIWGIIKPEYMTPPPMGAETVYTIVKNETLRSMWLRELKLVMGNIKVRDALEA